MSSFFGGSKAGHRMAGKQLVREEEADPTLTQEQEDEGFSSTGVCNLRMGAVVCTRIALCAREKVAPPGD